jgi:hypothetical protein
LILSPVDPVGGKRPIGATLALRQEDKGFMSRSDGASLLGRKASLSVPYWPFAPRRSALFSSTGFYTKTNRMCPELKEGKSLIGAEYRGKSFYIKVNAAASGQFRVSLNFFAFFVTIY